MTKTTTTEQVACACCGLVTDRFLLREPHVKDPRRPDKLVCRADRECFDRFVAARAQASLG